MNESFKKYTTKGNIVVNVKKENIGENELNDVISQMDTKIGGVFSSNYEYPGRYSRWEIAFVDPCIELRSFRNKILIQALKANGLPLLQRLSECFINSSCVSITEKNDVYLWLEIKKTQEIFTEEQRSKQNTVFSVIREIIDICHSDEDTKLGLYGAVGFDTVYQFESDIKLYKEREEKQEDIVLFIPDELYIKDNKYDCSYKKTYSFEYDGYKSNISDSDIINKRSYLEDYELEMENSQPGNYANIVRKAIERFKVGDMFEVVPSHVFTKESDLKITEIYNNMLNINPSPYNFLLNLGKEQLSGSSPEMFIRVEGNIVETCPISGTIKRGEDVLRDAENIKTLLNSEKDESELTMCTDVDRNDKSRICVPGSVEVIGRRQIELYSHLIHTVDHVKGTLKKGFDGLDAFLTHMWSVTVTGAPKKAAIEWIEQNEKTPRAWYGGAVGFFNFNGDINTGLTLRTVRKRNNKVQIRVGATLLIDSDPEAEEKETYIKAAAMMESLNFKPLVKISSNENQMVTNACNGKKILIIDHEDSFVHTLSNYIQQLGGDVTTLRYNCAKQELQKKEYDAVVLSPGPGKPERFDLAGTIEICLKRNIPILGVCLGLQGIVEYFGGELAVLDRPRHGRKLKLFFEEGGLNKGLNSNVEIGLYHSIHAKTVPDELICLAKDEENVVMAVKHKELPIIAVQFHPESIMSNKDRSGLIILNNMFSDILQ